MKRAAIVFVLLASWARGQQPAPDPAVISALMKEGNGLHDRGDFDGAIRKYREILALSPENPAATYEIGYSLFAKKDYPAALEMARVAGREPRLRPAAAVLAGNIHDEMGEPLKAIQTYRAAIAVDPGFFLLYFNLGVSYTRLERYDLARASLENAVVLAPNHPGSHFQLGRVYRAQGYRGPAIMALARALSLEPASARSREARSAIDAMFAAGVETNAKGNSTITVNPDVPKDEGDFSALEMLIPIISLTEKTIPEAGGKLDGPPKAHRLISLISSIGELEGRTFGRGFAAEHYAPFCAALVRNQAVPGFVALVLAGDDSPEIAAWRAQSTTAARQAASLAAAYHWASSKAPPLPPEPAGTPGPATPVQSPVIRSPVS